MYYSTIYLGKYEPKSSTEDPPSLRMTTYLTESLRTGRDDGAK